MSEPLEMNNLEMSEKAKPLLAAVIKHIRENVDPISEEFHRLGEGRADRWSYAPGQLELLETAKQKARDSGLWNFFLPNAETGEGLANLDYAYIAAELGKNPPRLGDAELFCAGYRQHGGAGTHRHATAKRHVAQTPARRQDPLGFCHDRTGQGVVRCQEHRHDRGA